MSLRMAWRMLVHEKARSLVSVLGVCFAVLLLFMQLGFFGSVLNGATMIYDALDFDLAVVSGRYTRMNQASSFTGRRLEQIAAQHDVEIVAPLYVGFARWTNAETRRPYSMMLIGFDPEDSVFRVAEIDAARPALRRPDTLLVDSASRAIYGPIDAGTRTELGGRTIEVLGPYALGTGFLELGIAVTSDISFERIIEQRTRDDVSVGLISLRPGADAVQVAQELRERLAADVQVLTRRQLYRIDWREWVVTTSTGFIFGSGVVVAFLVGIVILYQTLAAQVLDHLAEYATLKAMGYPAASLTRLVLGQAWLLAGLGFLPGMLAALWIYRVVRRAMLVPIEMSTGRVLLVLALTLGMSMLAGLVSVRKVRLADPADLF